MSAVLAALFYELCCWTAHFILLFGFSYRVTGRQYVPRRGPVLIISNHQSFLDPPAVGIAPPRHIHFLARKTLFNNRVFGFLIRMLNSVPIDQDGVGKDGIKNILAQLERGEAVLVFPEGERTPDGAMRPFRPGIALLLKRVRAPIVPVGVAGMYDAWPRHRLLPVFSPIFLPPTPRTVAVVFGPPRDPATLDGMSREEMMSVLEDDIRVMAKRAEALRRK